MKLNISTNHTIESANYITCIEPKIHPDRVMSCHDFLYMIDGEWEVVEEENVYYIHSDDLLILEAGKHHYGVSPCSPNNRHMYIHVIDECGGMENLREFHSLIHCRNNSRIKQLFEEIIAAAWSTEELKVQRQQMLFGLLLCEIYRQQMNENNPRVNIAEQAVSIIQTTPQTFFTCTDMASRFFVCERTLNNLFKKEYGKTFYNYQMDRKLEMIRQYLMFHPEVKLDEAARNFGFCDEFHLGKAYKKKYGISPKRHIKGL